MTVNLDQCHKSIQACSKCIHSGVVDGLPVCGADSEPIRFFDPSYACPKGKWVFEQVFIRGLSEPQVAFDEESKLLWINRPSPEIEAELDAEYERAGVLRWKVSDSLLSSAVGFIRSKASGRTAKPDVIAKRYLSCFGDANAPPCVALKQTDAGAFCGACRCGQRPDARLDGPASKLSFGYLECPMRKPGFSNER